MKLPKRVKGFTLIELLIVIAIIAVLSVIGAVIYGGVQKGSRDSRRVSDINAIASAMESKYGTAANAAGQYAPLAGVFFSSGQIPTDPLNASNSCNSVICKYCVRQNAAAKPITAAQIAACAAGDTTVAAGAPAGGASGNWVVCANLEAPASGSTTNYFYCRQNQQ